MLQPVTGQLIASGPLSFIDSAVDSLSGTLTAKAVFDNTDYTLVPGQYVDVQIDLDVAPGTVIIPTVSLQTGPAGSFVFVVDDENRIDVAPVTVLGTEGNMAAIESGLSAGAHVVVEGQLKLERGTLVADNVSEADWATLDTPESLRDRHPKTVADHNDTAERRAQ
ncbi:Multidrug resistance protein MdtA precursor [Methyloligella halotolerans]|uniref:Multidrug resistance protein MdtA n=1 Tax=Methyloligella halotolerans TaxID=1177755 RepID=A0A1E2RVB0_9HYPH|nr:hypothetical protein [Methyloligella halotolerans]ODA66050.1 Multidrug resistance protein MdtA precursor [Methyloligella halotolerans]